MAQKTMIEAITEALAIELRNDDLTLIFGEDVGLNGGVFRATQGLQAEFGEDRVCGVPCWSALMGHRYSSRRPKSRAR